MSLPRAVLRRSLQVLLLLTVAVPLSAQVINHPAASGNTESLVLQGFPEPGGQMDIHAFATPGSAVTFIFATMPQRQTIVGLTLEMSIPSIYALATVGADATGKASYPTAIPLTAPHGVFSICQACVVGPFGGLELSNASTIVTGFQPTTPVYPGRNAAMAAQVAGDLDGDGVLDLVGTSNANDTVSVSLGLGDGSFATPTVFTTGLGPTEVEVRDLDNDSHLDVIVLNETSGTLSLLWNDGLGGFTQQTMTAIQGAVNIATGDFDGDGNGDIALSGPMMLALFGDGNRNFTPTTVPVTGFPVDLAAADLDADGIDDIIYPTAMILPGVMETRMGTMSRVFANGPTLLAGIDPRFLHLGNLNGDNLPDLVIGDPIDARVLVFLGAGGGSFGFQQTMLLRDAFASELFSLGRSPIATGDIDDDGDVDIAVTDRQSGSVRLFPSSNGLFLPPLSVAIGDATAVAIADLDGDGLEDLGITTPNEFIVHRGLAGAPVSAGFGFEAGVDTRAVTLADLDLDGALDAVAANQSDVSVLMGVGAGAFSPPQSQTSVADPTAVAVGDLDGDGIPDLAVGGTNHGEVAILLGTGAGQFGAPTTLNVTMPTPLPASPSFDISDLDADGNLDLVLNGGVVLLGQGNGTFGPETVYANASGTLIVDVDRDDVLDLITLDKTVNDVLILIGVGDGTFQAPIPISVGPTASLDVEDMDGDGVPDIVVADGFSQSIGILTGLGGGLFSSNVPQNVGTIPSDIELSDLNGDGIIDIAVLGGIPTGNLTVFLGTGGGNFAPPQRFSVGRNVGLFTSGDVNGDGFRDLVIADGDSVDFLVQEGRVVVLLNERGLSFGP